MQKVFKVNGIDCANCAAKLEKAINKIDGVDSAIISFATGKMMLDADEKVFDQVVDKAIALAKELEPEWEIIK